jgi:hypothetical protein
MHLVGAAKPGMCVLCRQADMHSLTYGHRQSGTAQLVDFETYGSLVSSVQDATRAAGDSIM